MVKVCCVEGCKSETYANCGISFHRFPKNESMRAKWLGALGGGDRVLKMKNPVVCSRHFKIEDFKPTIIPRLTDDAVPYVIPLTKGDNITFTETASKQNCNHCPSTSRNGNINVSNKPPAKHARLNNVADVGTQTNLLIKSTKEETLKQKVKCLHQKLIRRNDKIKTLKKILKAIKKKHKNTMN